MYTQTLEKELKAYCIFDYEYSNIFTSEPRVIKKGEYVNILLMRYETNNIDKAVSYSYVIKETKHSIRKFSEHFITANIRRKMKIEKILKDIL